MAMALSVKRSVRLMPTVTIRDTGDLKRLTRQLRDQADGKELVKELRTGLREVLNPIRDQVKGAYRSAPSGRGRAGRRGGSLRGLLAKATRVEVRTTGKMAGARLRVDGRKMPSRAKAIPAYWEGYKRPWRHPVYGNREAWVTQPAHPIFDRIVESHEDDADRKVEQVLDGIRRKLEGGR
jgi:hypothetical protein